MNILVATKIEYCVEEEDIEDNLNFIRSKLGRKISAEKACEYFTKHPAKVYSIFGLPEELRIPKKYADDDDAITDYISDKTGWLVAGYNLINRDTNDKTVSRKKAV